MVKVTSFFLFFCFNFIYLFIYLFIFVSKKVKVTGNQDILNPYLILAFVFIRG
jgi:hypothetical protein